LLAFALLALGACDPQAAPPVAESPAHVQPIDEFFADVFEHQLAQSPVRQSQLGRQTDMLGEWDDVSDEFARLQLEESREDLARLRKNYDPAQLTEAEQLSYELFEFNAERAIANAEFRRHSYVVDQFNGQLSELITVLQNNHPVNDVGDAENYISRIAGLQQVLEEMTRQLKDRANFGVMAPAFSFPDVLTDARSISSGAPIDDAGHDNAVFADFREKISALDIDDQQKNEFLQRASQALRGPFAAGFATLIAEIERQQPLAYRNNGVWSLPNGPAFYQNRIVHHTTLNLPAGEIHKIGLSEVARIQDEMRGIMEQVAFEGSLAEFFDFIRNDPGNYYEDSDAGRADFLNEATQRADAIYEVVGDYFNQLPVAKLDVRRVEPWRENSTSIAFYDRPSEDGNRPGVYYANLADMSSVQRYVFSAITYHESVPGHHFQLALSQEIPALPAFRRYGGYGAFVEGWALYAEQLAGEMGFYETPYHDFGRLQNELWRAVRLVLDTGIHAMKWTREQSIDYFRENTPLSQGDIVTEVERFFVNPGQALGYKLGMIKILELRKRARLELGNDFDIRDFHDAVIGAGALPLPVLDRQVERYISAKKSAHTNNLVR
jgi:uncharacterized protein (DUF885 family)